MRFLHEDEEVVGTPTPSETGDAVLHCMMALVESSGPLELRLCETLAVMHGMDKRPLGYSGFEAFVREEVDIDPSWASQRIRLAKSELGLIKLALCRGAITVTAALKAPGLVAPGEELQWIAGVRSGAISLSMPPGKIPERACASERSAVSVAKTLMSKTFPAFSAASTSRMASV